MDDLMDFILSYLVPLDYYLGIGDQMSGERVAENLGGILKNGHGL